MTSAHDPLSAEERELAARLARLSAADGPPPALDARILAAAAGAVGAAPPASAAPRGVSAHRRPRATRRWPVAAGAVATLALAIGLAWQLRPTPESENDAFYSVADDAALRSAGPAAASAEPEPVPDMPAAASVADAVAPEAAEARRAAAPTAGAESAAGAAPQPRPAGVVLPADDRDAPRARIQSAPMEEAPIVFDDPSPVTTQTGPPAPAPPPPPPAAAPVVQQERSVQLRTAPERARQDAAAGNASEAKATGAAARRESDAVETTGSRVRDQQGLAAPEQEAYDASINDEPPATADSPDVQRAWLQRIRELAADGDVPGAKASLAEFRRRYPQHPIPDDLRGLSQP